MQKNDFRQLWCRNLIHTAQRKNKLKINHMALKNLISVLNRLHYKRILFFYPLSFEVNTRRVMQVCRRKGKKVFLPKVCGKSFQIHPISIVLKKDKNGILAPVTKFCLKIPDVMIVPIVGFDSNLGRIGMGAGMYDRYFAQLKKKPIVIFLQTLRQFCPQRITQSHDIRADFVITSQKIHYKK